MTHQDALATHLPGKVAVAAQLRDGVFPFLFPGASCVEPLAGNPNFGTFFPDTLLFLLLPPYAAFGLHFALSAVLALVGARRWARAEGIPAPAAELAGFVFALSGVYVSTWKFYNSGMALALAPWLLAATTKIVRRAEQRDGARIRRAVVELGLWGALEVLAGEPVVALLCLGLACCGSLARLLAPDPEARPGLTRSAVVSLAAGLLLAGLLAAPQVAATMQVLGDSVRLRLPFPFVVATATSVHPVRVVEQLVPFPFGRPDIRGPGGFMGHHFFGEGHPVPYLWTLHVGLTTLALLLAFSRPSKREELYLWLILVTAVLLSLGRFLPGARSLEPLLSLYGRIRFPVKWWYVVALCLVPLVGWAARRWQDGAPPRRGAVPAILVLLALAILAATQVLDDPVSLLGSLASIASLGAFLAVLLRGTGRPRSASLLAAGIAGSLFTCHLPLFLAVLDRPMPPPPNVGTGRIFVRVGVVAYPQHAGVAKPSVRDFYRREFRELWPLTGALRGVDYAFNDDPDGCYSADDRRVRLAVDDLPWPERAIELRLAGVSQVVTNQALELPYREVTELGRPDVHLYALDGPVPSVRFATRVISRRDTEAVLACHRRPDFDPMREVVVAGPRDSETGAPSETHTITTAETTDRLSTQVDTPLPGILVWSRTFFSGWWARVDGAPAQTVLAEGHLLGVPVPAGLHRVEVGWSRAPLLAGFMLFGVGLVAGLFVRGASARPERVVGS